MHLLVTLLTLTSTPAVAAVGTTTVAAADTATVTAGLGDARAAVDVVAPAHAPHEVAARTTAASEASGTSVRVELGTRTGAWVGAYAAPGIGGDLELTLADAVGVDLYSDHFAMVGATLRHDHIIGFSLFTPRLLGWSDGFVSPTFGACVDFRFEHADDGPSSSSVLFGVHAGVMAKVFALYDFSFQLSAEGHLYTGNMGERSGWTVRPTDGLGASPVAVVVGGIGYAL